MPAGQSWPWIRRCFWCLVVSRRILQYPWRLGLGGGAGLASPWRTGGSEKADDGEEWACHGTTYRAALPGFPRRGGSWDTGFDRPLP
ncbi:hypothetical protein F5X68DRAFT_202757 [Plectosphaerella plurivora]|uniref:Secreted protein n=1 Tax=Plectosphaerella plurivora TaxID=936078 RepID=A0A9P9AEQ3_9PEZI|nr:hypothetical protein F5X68DRAFT_202757 [Plectosphaerella plurivora]